MFSLINTQRLNTANSLLIKEKKALAILACFHLIIIAASNYLVQIPIVIPLQDIGLSSEPIHTTWGAFTFPFIFLATDLTVRIFGSRLARKIIFVCMFPALILSYVISVLFFETQFQGVESLKVFSMFVFRIAFASFAAYCIGQLIDIKVFDRLRKLPQWYIAPAASSIAGNAIDAALFFAIAFYKCEDVFMAENWVELAWTDYATRIVIAVLFFLPAYGALLAYLSKKLKTQE